MNYYYLDKEDGYSKGPYTWENLMRLPLPSDTYIYNEQLVEWRTIEGYQAKMAAESKAKVRQAPRPKKPALPFEPAEPEHAGYEHFPPPSSQETWRKPAPTQRRDPLPLPAPMPRPAPRPDQLPDQRRSPMPAPAPKYDKRRPMPPMQPMQPGEDDDNPMGISGVGCFVWAIILALVFGLIFGVMWYG